ncbi:3-oxoacyl-ACP reductase FabG [Schleiferilactobacillus harbinensis]|uniref:3-oxoacyl-ACP reductase FabG n=1 Tax=Schleiferilactobacillus harbinensis TaxID=304207 RepID=A0A510TUY4_9LACO|nr:3-oxoacyl-ACP reductase FabG [Schleiferilactobacillus harbinensis]QFR24800.1 SDR family oxidoreductase [Schleiferilactobacillus harbinensis]GEK06106.1 3-oxoacyl-ACP reductase [Schleiferilactobacillus harbinensis]
MAEEQPVALVTGARTGIGRAIAERLQQDGYRVALNVHRALTDDEQAELGQIFQPLTVVVGDVADETAAEAMVSQVQDQFGRLDLLVNNAGLNRDTLLTRMKAADFEQVVHTNLTGAFLMTKYALKLMQKQRAGNIVNISSIAGLRGNIGQANYAASKAGIIGLTKTAAREGALRGVRCNAVAPGMIHTAMTAAMSEKRQEEFASQIPLKRFGDPTEIADAVAFLAGNAYITGQVLTVDGGLTI